MQSMLRVPTFLEMSIAFKVANSVDFKLSTNIRHLQGRIKLKTRQTEKRTTTITAENCGKFKESTKFVKSLFTCHLRE